MLNLLLCSLICAVLANGVAEFILAFDLGLPYARLTPQSQRIRLFRWLASSMGCILLGAGRVPVGYQLLFALFSISAATDLETKMLPPDGFLFSAVIVGVIAHGLSNQGPSLQQAILAQAFCFAVVTLGVALFNVCDSGDIKLALQFGAASGSLQQLLFGTGVVWLVACAVILVATIIQLQKVELKAALRNATTLHPPQGPLLWCGLLVACMVAR